jgi:hypothetical protein
MGEEASGEDFDQMVDDIEGGDEGGET